MHINLNFRVPNNTLKVHPMKHDLVQREKVCKSEGRQERKDNVSISPAGKAMSMMESLFKQKQNITKNKNDLISNTLEKGGSLEDIKTQLKTYDEQLKLIEEQISKTMIEQDNTGKTEQDKSIHPKTKEQAEADALNSIVNASAKVSNAKVISSMKNRLEGQTKIWDREIEKDGVHASESKQKDLVDMKVKLSLLNGSIASELNELV